MFSCHKGNTYKYLPVLPEKCKSRFQGNYLANYRIMLIKHSRVPEPN